MRSNAQIEASRKNGARSNGPATEQGRARSGQNARRHGLNSRKSVLIDGESQEEWDFFHNAFIEKFQPRDFVEERLVIEMAITQWRLERVWALQAAAINQELPVQLRKAQDRFKKFDAVLVQSAAYLARQDDLLGLDQHEARLSRHFDRTLRKFKEIRAQFPPVENWENEPEPAQNNIIPISAGTQLNTIEKTENDEIEPRNNQINPRSPNYGHPHPMSIRTKGDHP